METELGKLIKELLSAKIDFEKEIVNMLEVSMETAEQKKTYKEKYTVLQSLIQSLINDITEVF